MHAEPIAVQRKSETVTRQAFFSKLRCSRETRFRQVRPPVLGAEYVTLPHSLQASAKLPICRGLLMVSTPTGSLRHPSGVGSKRSTGNVPCGMAKVKLASLGQVGRHLSQVRQSKSTS